MIIDAYSNIEKYEAVLPHLQEGLKAIDAVKEPVLNEHYPFDGGWFMVQEGMTKPLETGDFEAHRKYIDVQILLQGKEEIAWENIEYLNTVISYDEKTDKEKLSGEKEHHILISRGMFWAAFPWDGHKAVSHVERPYTFRKIVLKLEVV